MAGLLDVLLRGAILVLTSLALGGVVWTRFVLRAEPHTKPSAPTVLALRVVAASSGLAVLAQLATLIVALAALGTVGHWPLADLGHTTLARTSLARVVLGALVGGLAVTLARRPASPALWHALTAGTFALVATSAVLSHAVARVESRTALVALDALHQIAAAVWIGGLAHLTAYAALRRREVQRGISVPDDGQVIGRFSTLALAAVVTLVVAGVLLTWVYVEEAAALLGTAYGVMILSKVVLLVAILALAWANVTTVRRARHGNDFRLLRFVEVELGLGVTVLFAAASLTSLPPAVDVTIDRATVSEVASRFRPSPPRLSSPPVHELIDRAEPLMGAVTRREPVERAWSEYNHHWAGFFVLSMGLLAALERLGVRAARHWPLLFLGLAGFLFARNDPRAWPLGPAGFWESLSLPDVLQHRAFVVLIVALSVFEWMVRSGGLARRPWGYVFPLLCAVGGGLLLTHSHAMFNLKNEFLAEVTHAPIGILGAFAGWARWLELRLPAARRPAGWLWIACFTTIGFLLLVYREA
jgi:putative copper resistance protein D